MKKLNKRMLLGIIMILFSVFMMTALQANAVSKDSKFVEIEYFSEDIPKEKLEQICDIMLGITEPSTRWIFCIFGHSIATGTTRTIEHMYYPTYPRCKETVSAIEYCTRDTCDYFKIKDQAINILGCCP